MASPGDVLVTGAGRGLGRGVAAAFAHAGWRVWMASDVAEELEHTAHLIGRSGAVTPVMVDLTRVGECQRLVEVVARDAERLRAVVNNAAVLHRSAVEHMSLDDWDRTLAVNLTAPMVITRGLLPRLAGGGSVVNVSSRAGVEPFEDEAAYCASKFGLEAFSRCLALELEGRPISVNTITPGCRIKPTSVTDRDLANVPAAQQNTWTDPITLGPAFLFLAELMGEVSGRRFNATSLTAALARDGAAATLDGIDDLYD